MLGSVLAFAGVAAVANVTPGLDSLFVLRTSAASGRAAGRAAAFGVNTGCLSWASRPRSASTPAACPGASRPRSA